MGLDNLCDILEAGKDVVALDSEGLADGSYEL